MWRGRCSINCWLNWKESNQLQHACWLSPSYFSYRNYSLEIVMNFVRKYVYVDVEGNIVYLRNFKFEKLELAKMSKIRQWLNKLWVICSEEYLATIKSHVVEGY